MVEIKQRNSKKEFSRSEDWYKFEEIPNSDPLTRRYKKLSTRVIERLITALQTIVEQFTLRRMGKLSIPF